MSDTKPATPPTVGGRAERVDPVTGVREIAEIRGDEQPGLCVYTHLPPQPAHSGLIVVSPLMAEFLKNYRREVLLARHLAAQGVLVRRFEYRGVGNSGGDPATVTFPDLVDDADQAAHHQPRPSRWAVLGTRFGAMVAAGLAARLPGAPLVLWDPTVDDQSYFRVLERARALQQRAEALSEQQGGEPAPTLVPLATAIEQAGWADVMGSSLFRPLYETTRPRSLLDELGADPRPVLILQISTLDQVRPDLASLHNRLRERGSGCELSVVAGEVENWWFRQGVRGFQTEEDRTLTASLLQATTTWLRLHLEGGGG